MWGFPGNGAGVKTEFFRQGTTSVAPPPCPSLVCHPEACPERSRRKRSDEDLLFRQGALPEKQIPRMSQRYSSYSARNRWFVIPSEAVLPPLERKTPPRPVLPLVPRRGIGWSF